MTEPVNRKIFQYFIVARYNKEEGAVITYSWPPNLSADQTKFLRCASRFAVPFQNYTCEAVERYCFIMTSDEYVKTYGFCRFSPSLDACLCILSFNPWHEFFHCVLDNLSRFVIEPKIDPTPFLDGLTNTINSYPKSDIKLKFPSIKMDPWKMPAMPPEHGLPKLMQSKNLLEYYNVISAPSIVTIFTLMLLENRMVFYSSKLGRLTSCIHAACSLLFPLTWQHTVIPILTPDILEYVGCPTPIIVGVHKGMQADVEQRIKKDTTGQEVVEIYLDENEIFVGPDQKDIELPYPVSDMLFERLKSMTPDRRGRVKECPVDNDSFARAFLDALVALIGDYRSGLTTDNHRVVDPYENKDDYNREKLFATRPDEYRSFLDKLTSTLHFQMFCRDRVKQINDGGSSLSDPFEKARLSFKPLGTGAPRRILKNMKVRIAHGGKEKIKMVREFGIDTWKRINEPRKSNHQNDTRRSGSVPDLSEVSKSKIDSTLFLNYTSYFDKPNAKMYTPVSRIMQRFNVKVSSEEEVKRRYELIPESEYQDPIFNVSLLDDPEIQACLRKSRSVSNIVDKDSENESAGETAMLQEASKQIEPRRPRALSRDVPVLAPPPRPPPPKPPKPARPAPPKESSLSVVSDSDERPVQPPKPKSRLRQSIRNSIMADYAQESAPQTQPLAPTVVSQPPSASPIDPILKDFDPLVSGDDAGNDGVVKLRGNAVDGDCRKESDLMLAMDANIFTSRFTASMYQSVTSEKSDASFYSARSNTASILDDDVTPEDENSSSMAYEVWLEAQRQTLKSAPSNRSVSPTTSTPTPKSRGNGSAPKWTTFDE